MAPALTWGGGERKPTQTSALEKTLEAAPVNMATLMAAMFAAEGKATLASNATFGEMLEEPPEWMGVVANKHPEMAEAIATVGSIASAAVGAQPQLNAEVVRLRNQNKQLKEELANLKVTPLSPALVGIRPACAGAAALCCGQAPRLETNPIPPPQQSSPVRALPERPTGGLIFNSLPTSSRRTILPPRGRGAHWVAVGSSGNVLGGGPRSTGELPTTPPQRGVTPGNDGS